MKIVYEDHWKDVPVYDEQTKQVVVQRKLLREPVYVADDGQRFNSIDDCRDYEEYLNGTKKICPRCGGRGEINIEHHHGYDPGVCGEIEGDWGERCPECDGKGFLRLVTTTKWE